jgi:hypothetical protein
MTAIGNSCFWLVLHRIFPLSLCFMYVSFLSLVFSIYCIILYVCMLYFVFILLISFRFVSFLLISFRFRWFRFVSFLFRFALYRCPYSCCFFLFFLIIFCLFVLFCICLLLITHVHYPQLNSSRVCLPTNFQKFKCHIFICVWVWVSIYEL